MNLIESIGKISARYTSLMPLVLAFILSLSLIRNVARVRRAESEIDQVEERLAAIKTENLKLEDELEMVQSEDYIEKQLRDKLGMAREGEIIVILPADDVVRKFAPEEEVEDEVLPDPNWKKWIKLFGFEL